MALTKVGKEGITGIDNSSDATAMTISSDEDVMIGTTDESSGAKFIVGSTDDDKRAFIQGSNQYRLGLKNGSNNHVWLGSGGADNFRVSNSSGSTLFELNSSGNIVLPSSNAGIHLGVTSATASNLLDDYEEGTWTPVSGGGNGSTAYYTKVGRLVQIEGDVTFSGNSGSTNFISGLPFAPVTQGGAICVWQNIQSGVIGLLTGSGGMYLYNGQTTNINLGTGKRIIFSVTYYTS